jgi:hypothetical protein
MAMTECLMSVSLYDTMRACMTENRQPDPQEIDRVAAKIWRDAYSHRANLQWTQVKTGSADHRRTLAAAHAALGLHRGLRPARAKAA